MQERFFIRKLIASMKCVVCGHGYDRSNVSVLGHKEALWFLSVYCPSCHSQGLVAAMLQENGKIELTENERDVFGKKGPVSGDDVLDTHNFLKDFDGDFARVFLEGKKGR